MRRQLGLLLCAACFAGCSVGAQTRSADPSLPETASATAAGTVHPAPTYVEWEIPKRPPSELANAAPLEALNGYFRSAYAEARDDVQNRLGPVILLRFSAATLFKNGKPVETVRVIPRAYHDLRYAAHVPFTLYLKLATRCDTAIDAPTLDWLGVYQAGLVASQPAVAALGLSPEQKARQHRLLEAAKHFVDGAIDAKAVTCEELSAYARSASRDVEANIFDAGAEQVDGLHTQLLKWRPQFSEAEWSRVRFIVRGPQQPRGCHAAVLYLSALVQDAGDGRGYTGESERVVFREDTAFPPAPGATPWTDDFRLLAALELDTGASQALFSDPDRLAVDIAAQGARARTREIDFSGLR